MRAAAGNFPHRSTCQAGGARGPESRTLRSGPRAAPSATFLHTGPRRLAHLLDSTSPPTDVSAPFSRQLARNDGTQRRSDVTPVRLGRCPPRGRRQCPRCGAASYFTSPRKVSWLAAPSSPLSPPRARGHFAGPPPSPLPPLPGVGHRRPADPRHPLNYLGRARSSDSLLTAPATHRGHLGRF